MSTPRESRTDPGAPSEGPLSGSQNLAFVEDLYAEFLADPASVAPDWRRYFESLTGNGGSTAPARPGPSFRPASVFNPPAPSGGNGHTGLAVSEFAALQDRVDQMIRAYRVRGHLISDLDPLGLPRGEQPELEPGFYGLTGADLDRVFSSRTIAGTPDQLTLRGILEHLRTTYCRSIGVQFMHIDDLRIKMWLQERMEESRNRIRLSHEEQLRILTRLTSAVVFEEFIQKKYLGAKRFSLEGAESLIPLLDLAIEHAGDHGCEEIILGMAHRGRLNVLANIIGKSPRDIFREFEDTDAEYFWGRGDVKYHLGHSGDRKVASGRTVHLSLCFNPSHLEFVNPVALGRVRAKQDRRGDRERERVLGILIHGDASFAGQGVVQESLNLSELRGYRTGGTLHIVVNNQIGFTTAPQEGRSSLYATAVARMLQIPIFHVNGEDPEAVAQVVRLALDFRRQFRRDVMIDMYCYRRHGHNETDEPAFTHPVMYRAIHARRSVRRSYLERLKRMGEVTDEQADEIVKTTRALLEKELSRARSEDYRLHVDTLQGVWRGYAGGAENGHGHVATAVPRARLAELLEAATRLPEGFEAHPKVERWLGSRREMAAGERPLDWAAGEALAFASLVTEGHRVRLSGQDSGRGTFSHRHAILHERTSGEAYTPLQHLTPDQAPCEVLNSPLSETGVLGFDYGYSLDCPEGLILWEAQFGDFCNAAQVMIDQFITSAEDKWSRLNGIVLLLPHGFEGQGPEHSSARLERFLLLAAEDNIQVVNPTTPAQYFHVLRRQVLRPWRKPLIVMTPKSLLRHPKVVSPLEKLSRGEFHCLLPDLGRVDPAKVARVLLCSGKVYYELEEERETRRRDDVAILRLEQLYPLHREEFEEALAPYPKGTPVFWVQEEPENMGAWRFLRVQFGDRLYRRHPFAGISRQASASPATGSTASHRLEQKEIMERAFNAM